MQDSRRPGVLTCGSKMTHRQIKPIKEFPGYGVSPDGAVWSKWSNSGKQSKADWVQLRPGVNGGYRRVLLMREGIRNQILVHRLVVEAFIGTIPAGMEVNHINGIKGDNRVENLEICSHKENRIHACGVLGKGTGAGNGRAKLSETEVLEIRSQREDGSTLEFLSSKYSVSTNQISRIHHKQRWAHLPEEVR